MHKHGSGISMEDCSPQRLCAKVRLLQPGKKVTHPPGLGSLHPAVASACPASLPGWLPAASSCPGPGWWSAACAWGWQTCRMKQQRHRQGNTTGQQRWGEHSGGGRPSFVFMGGQHIQAARSHCCSCASAPVHKGPQRQRSSSVNDQGHRKDTVKLAAQWVTSPHLAGVVYSPSRARVAAPPAPAAAISTSSAAASPMRAMASSSASDT